MNDKTLLPIPRESLAKLLAESGSTQTPEEFLKQREIQSAVALNANFAKRAKAAYWSRLWLLLSATISIISWIFSPNWEDFIAGLLLSGMTVVEFKVHQWFLENDPRAPLWGWRNQCLFSALFVLYGAYHLLIPSPSLAVLDEMGVENMAASVTEIEKIFYFSVGLGGALGQLLLARYYKNATKLD